MSTDKELRQMALAQNRLPNRVGARTAPTPTVRAVVVIAALTRLAKAWERWDAATREDEPAAEVELEQARGVVRGMGVLND